MRSSRTLSNIGLLAVAATLMLVSKRWESALTVVLPVIVINWIISREHRLRGAGAHSAIRWQTAFLNFAVPLVLCLCVILFWFPRHLGSFPIWGAYLIGSFSMALLLVKLYERFLRMRKLEQPAEK